CVPEFGDPIEVVEIEGIAGAVHRPAAGAHLLQELFVSVAHGEGDALERGPAQVDPDGPSRLVLQTEWRIGVAIEAPRPRRRGREAVGERELELPLDHVPITVGLVKLPQRAALTLQGVW